MPVSSDAARVSTGDDPELPKQSCLVEASPAFDDPIALDSEDVYPGHSDGLSGRGYAHQRRGGVCVPLAVKRSTTMSPSAINCSTSLRQIGGIGEVPGLDPHGRLAVPAGIAPRLGASRPARPARREMAGRG